MYIPEEREAVNEYSVDDESIKNIMHEISDDEGFQAYLLRIAELLESVESQKVNVIINYLLYGMILQEGQTLESISSHHPELKTLLEGYCVGLDKVESALSDSKELESESFPCLVDNLRMDKDFYKKHRKEINSFLKMLPDVRKNLEDLSCRIMGIK